MASRLGREESLEWVSVGRVKPTEGHNRIQLNGAEKPKHTCPFGLTERRPRDWEKVKRRRSWNRVKAERRLRNWGKAET